MFCDNREHPWPLHLPAHGKPRISCTIDRPEVAACVGPFICRPIYPLACVFDVPFIYVPKTQDLVVVAEAGYHPLHRGSCRSAFLSQDGKPRLLGTRLPGKNCLRTCTQNYAGHHAQPLTLLSASPLAGLLCR